jgi:hypothetical protein
MDLKRIFFLGCRRIASTTCRHSPSSWLQERYKGLPTMPPADVSYGQRSAALIGDFCGAKYDKNSYDHTVSGNFPREKNIFVRF